MKMESGKIALLETPENERATIIKRAKEKLRQRVLEEKAWEWLLQLENLTINGNIIWAKKQQPPNLIKRKRKKK